MRRIQIYFITVYLLGFFNFCMAESTIHELNHNSQQSINITIYPEQMALINERRKVVLKPGMNKLLVRDIPGEIIADSLLVRLLGNEKDNIKLVEYNFNSGLLSESNLFEEAIGEAIKILPEKPVEKPLDAKLLSYSEKKVWVLSEGIIFSVPKERIAFKSPSYNMLSKPVLTIKLFNKNETACEFELSYLAKGFSWNAGYTVTINEMEDTLDLTNWIKINNASGVNIKKAQFRIIGVQDNQSTKISFPQHITLPHKYIKNISWLSAKGIPATKSFRIYPNSSITENEEGKVMRPKVETWLSISNTKSHNLGFVLPEGNVKVFQRDTEGRLLYIGEHKTGIVANNKPFSVRLSTTNDISAEMHQTDYRKLGAQVVEAGYRLDLKNNTKQSQQVFVVQNVSGQWSVLRETHAHETEGEHRIRWMLELPPEETLSLRYRIRMSPN